MLVWYVLFPLAIMGSLAYRGKSTVIVCAIMALGVLTMATVGTMVGSDLYRHRVVAMGLIAVLAAGGLQKDIKRRYRWIFWLWTLGAVFFTGTWITLRLGA